MIEKTQISIWDFFVYLLSGWGVIASLLLHGVLLGVVELNIVKEAPVGFLVTMLIPGMLFLGMLLEPVANILEKLLKAMFNPIMFVEILGVSRWDQRIAKLKYRAQSLVPKDIQETCYQYAKNWLDANGRSVNYMPHLAKFGYYRNLSFIMLANAAAMLSLYPLNTLNIRCSILGLVCLSYIYWYRSEVFYRHLGVLVYTAFIHGHPNHSPRETETPTGINLQSVKTTKSDIKSRPQSAGPTNWMQRLGTRLRTRPEQHQTTERPETNEDS